MLFLSGRFLIPIATPHQSIHQTGRWRFVSTNTMPLVSEAQIRLQSCSGLTD